MAPEGGDPPSDPRGARQSWPFPTLGQVVHFARELWSLTTTVTRLEADNKRLAEEVKVLQRQVDRQAAQLDLLVNFVSMGIERLEERLKRIPDEASPGKPRQRRPRRTDP